MNLRKKSTREEFERALAQCKPEDFDGHTEFHRLTPSSGSNGYARPRRSFTNSKAKQIPALGTDSYRAHLNPFPGKGESEGRCECVISDQSVVR
jgi:hypothetical protein